MLKSNAKTNKTFSGHSPSIHPCNMLPPPLPVPNAPITNTPSPIQAIHAIIKFPTNSTTPSFVSTDKALFVPAEHVTPPKNEENAQELPTIKTMILILYKIRSRK